MRAAWERTEGSARMSEGSDGGRDSRPGRDVAAVNDQEMSETRRNDAPAGAAGHTPDDADTYGLYQRGLQLLERGSAMKTVCGPHFSTGTNCGLQLGTAMAHFHDQGRDKVTILASSQIAQFSALTTFNS